MIGSMFAGTEEAPGETIIFNGRKFKSYRGMGSIDAMKAGSADRYFQKGCEGNISKLVPEGIAARVPFKGSLSETVYQLIGGVRSGMGYCGAKDIETLQAGPVHPHHGFGHAGEPSARRSHHERGAQLFERTVDGTPGFEIRLVDSGGGVRTVRRMADHPPSGAAYAGPCGGVGLSSPARVGGLSKFWKVIERLIWKKS